VCVLHCAQLLHTILHRTDLIIFPCYPTDNHHCSDDVNLSEGGETQGHFVFWETFRKTIRLMLSVRCPSVCPVCLSCPVCDVGLLWPNGWMHQDETWHTGKPRPGLIVLDGDPPSPPPKRRSPQFSAHICCDQMAGWVKMPLGREIGLGTGDIVLDGDPAPSKKGVGQQPPIFGPFIVAKRLDGSICHLVRT